MCYNFQGIVLVTELIDNYGLQTVQAYMGHIQVHTLNTHYYSAEKRDSYCYEPRSLPINVAKSCMKNLVIVRSPVYFFAGAVPRGWNTGLIPSPLQLTMW